MVFIRNVLCYNKTSERSLFMFDFLTFRNFISILRLLLDIGVLWIIIYYGLKIVRNNSRTVQIFKGIFFIFIIRILATQFGLKTIEVLTAQLINWGPMAIIIIFQPELRSMLERLGKSNVFSRLSTLTVNEREILVNELAKACTQLSKTRTGALITLEQGTSLADYINGATKMNSVVTSELLCSIFAYGTPLHDGAVIIQGDRIACASAYFPPTEKDFPSSYGARHRAAVGISEVSDSVTIVVSEETGTISIAEDGKLTVMDDRELRNFLMRIICQVSTDVSHDPIKKDLSKDQELELDDEDKTEVKPSKFTTYIKNKTKSITTPKPKKEKTTKKNPNKEEENVVEEKVPSKQLSDEERFDSLMENFDKKEKEKNIQMSLDEDLEVKEKKSAKEEQKKTPKNQEDGDLIKAEQIIVNLKSMKDDNDASKNKGGDN